MEMHPELERVLLAVALAPGATAKDVAIALGKGPNGGAVGPKLHQLQRRGLLEERLGRWRLGRVPEAVLARIHDQERAVADLATRTAAAAGNGISQRVRPSDIQRAREWVSQEGHGRDVLGALCAPEDALLAYVRHGDLDRLEGHAADRVRALARAVGTFPRKAAAAAWAIHRTNACGEGSHLP